MWNMLPLYNMQHRSHVGEKVRSEHAALCRFRLHHRGTLEQGDLIFVRPGPNGAARQVGTGTSAARPVRLRRR